ncbi:hypothetical protein [Streptomyces sp. NPDC051211]|uniref:hypothetical protein n=1 Tax=Streptomyces sp. NPDC051211 TaxID=3154643 RepID=UPI00344CD0DA
MADDRNSWLDGAAAERLLRGEPVGPVADHRSRAEAARLHRILEELAPPAAPADGELPGEAAALAAFRAAHGTAGARPVARPEPEAEPVSGPEQLVALGMPTTTRPVRPARNRPFRLGLAAALASVALGGVAAAAGSGLLDRALHASAGPGPAVSLNIEPTPRLVPDPADGTTTPWATPDGSPHPHRDGDGSAGTPTPGGDGRTTPDTGGTVNAGGTTGGDTGGDRARPDDGHGTRKDPGTGDTTGTDSTTGTGGAAKDRDDDRAKVRITELCREFRAGRIAEDQKDRLAREAKGQRIAQYCDRLLNTGGTGTSGDSGRDTDNRDDGDGILEAPPLKPALPAPTAGDGSLKLTPDTRL